MNYYLYNESKKDLSDPITEKWIADYQLSKLHKNTRDKTKVISIPEIKEGLKLFTGTKENPKYYETIIGSSASSWICDYTDGRPSQQPQDMFIKDNLLKLFLKGTLAPIEEYESEDRIEYIHVNNVALEGTEVNINEENEIEI